MWISLLIVFSDWRESRCSIGWLRYIISGHISFHGRTWVAILKEINFNSHHCVIIIHLCESESYGSIYLHRFKNSVVENTQESCSTVPGHSRLQSDSVLACSSVFWFNTISRILNSLFVKPLSCYSHCHENIMIIRFVHNKLIVIVVSVFMIHIGYRYPIIFSAYWLQSQLICNYRYLKPCTIIQL